MHRCGVLRGEQAAVKLRLDHPAHRGFLGVLVGVSGGILLAGLAAMVSPYIAAALVAGLIVAAAVLRWPWLGFALTVLAVPLERIGRFTNDSSMYTFSLMRVLGALTMAAVGAHFLLGKRRFAAPGPVLLYLAYVLLALVSLSYTSDWFSGVRQSFVVLGNMLFFFLVVNIIDNVRQANLAIALWLCSTFAIGLFTIYQWHNPAATVSEDRFKVTGERSTEARFSTVLEDFAENESIGYIRRAMGPTSSPAVYGINVILALPFYAWAFRVARTGWMRWAAVIGGLVAAYNVMLTNTRAAVITFGVAVLLMLIFRLIRVRAPGVVATLVLCAALIPFMPSALYERVFDVKNYTVERSATLRVRLIYWQAALGVFAGSPLIGIGVGNQSELPRRITEIPMPPNSSVHNEYLESLLETGLIGYPLIIAFLVCLYRRCRFAERTFGARGDESTRLLLISARIGFLCVLFYAVQCDVLHFPLKSWWLTMGVVVVLSQLAAKLMALKAGATTEALLEAA